MARLWRWLTALPWQDIVVGVLMVAYIGGILFWFWWIMVLIGWALTGGGQY